MPAIRQVKGRLKVSYFDETVSRMSMTELIEYEHFLWDWMEAGSPAKITRILNMIHREVEWRAQDTDFGQGP